jgi:MORN repeat
MDCSDSDAHLTIFSCSKLFYRYSFAYFFWFRYDIKNSEFLNGQREGQGVYKFSDGGKYEGSWRDGRYSGFGICSWEDGRCYKGYVSRKRIFFVSVFVFLSRSLIHLRIVHRIFSSVLVQ